MNYLILGGAALFIYGVLVPLAALAEVRELDDRTKDRYLKQDDSDLPKWRRVVRRWVLS